MSDEDMLIPIVISTKYLSQKFTIWTSVLTAMVFAIVCVLFAYMGIALDMNITSML